MAARPSWTTTARHLSIAEHTTNARKVATFARQCARENNWRARVGARGVGPKIALVPYVHITASLDEPTKRQVRHKRLITASTMAVALVIFGALLRARCISVWDLYRSPVA